MSVEGLMGYNKVLNISNKMAVHCHGQVSTLIHKDLVMLSNKANASAMVRPFTQLIYVTSKNTSVVLEMTCSIQDLAMPTKVRDRVANVVLSLAISYPTIASYAFSMDDSIQDLLSIAAVTNFFKWTEITKNVQSE